jgi:hypothetical protein
MPVNFAPQSNRPGKSLSLAAIQFLKPKSGPTVFGRVVVSNAPISVIQVASAVAQKLPFLAVAGACSLLAFLFIDRIRRHGGRRVEGYALHAMHVEALRNRNESSSERWPRGEPVRPRIIVTRCG